MYSVLINLLYSRVFSFRIPNKGSSTGAVLLNLSVLTGKVWEYVIPNLTYRYPARNEKIYCTVNQISSILVKLLRYDRYTVFMVPGTAFLKSTYP